MPKVSPCQFNTDRLRLGLAGAPFLPAPSVLTVMPLPCSKIREAGSGRKGAENFSPVTSAYSGEIRSRLESLPRTETEMDPPSGRPAGFNLKAFAGTTNTLSPSRFSGALNAKPLFGASRLGNHWFGAKGIGESDLVLAPSRTRSFRPRSFRNSTPPAEKAGPPR